MNSPTAIIIFSNVLTAIVTVLLGFLLTRKRDSSQVLFNTTSAYTNMLNAMQGQIDSQAEQIKILEGKLQSYIDLINSYAARETGYLAQISRLENQLKVARKTKNEANS